MAKKKMFSTKGFKSVEEKEKEKRTIHVSDPSLNRGLVGCQTQLYARSIAGGHDSKSNPKGTKNPNGRKAVKVALRKGEWDF